MQLLSSTFVLSMIGLKALGTLKEWPVALLNATFLACPNELVERIKTCGIGIVDLYDTERSATVMAKLFQVKATCWGHSNKGTQTRMETRRETRREARSQRLSMQTEKAGKLLGTQT
jgi:hypothetical protein